MIYVKCLELVQVVLLVRYRTIFKIHFRVIISMYLYFDTKHLIPNYCLNNEMKENQKKQIGQEIKYQIAGWILFIICAIFFIASSFKNHDTLTFIGSVFFLVACIVFLIPIFNTYKTTEDDTKLNDGK